MSNLFSRDRLAMWNYGWAWLDMHCRVSRDLTDRVRIQRNQAVAVANPEFVG
ncbi:MAG: hypothetical protein JJU36_09465 [Phycisphaeraceae bacterium]|nr:hypothetical protein [Phycisphaeraceae bacterium]